MHEIFISYSSKRRGLTRKLEKAIEAKFGRDSVWCDNKLESWGSFEGNIHAKTEAARVIVVIWNEDAAASDSIKSEAQTALAQGQLVNVAMDGFPAGKIPMPYSIYRISLLSDIEGILESITGVMAGEPLEIAVSGEEDRGGDPGGQLPDAAPEKARAAAPLKEAGARDGGGSHPGVEPEKVETAGPSKEHDTADDGGLLSGAAQEKREAAAPPKEADARDGGGSLPGVELEKVEIAGPSKTDDTPNDGGLLSGAAQQKHEAVAPPKEEDARDGGKPLPSVELEKVEAAGSSKEDDARDYGGPLSSTVQERLETAASLADSGAGIVADSLAGVAQEQFEPGPSPYEDSLFLYSAPLPDVMWEKPEAVAPFGKAGVHGEAGPPPKVKEAKPGIAGPSAKDAAYDDGELLLRVMQEELEAAASLEEDAGFDHGSAFDGIAEKKPEATAPSKEDATRDRASTLPRTAEGETKVAASLEEDAVPWRGDALPGIGQEKPEAAAPTEESSTPGDGGTLISALEVKLEEAAPLEEAPALADGAAFTGAAEEKLEEAAPLEEGSTPGDGGAFANALKEKPEEAAPLAEAPALDDGGAFASALEEKPGEAAPLAEAPALDDGAAFPATVEEKPEATAPLEQYAAPGHSAALHAAAEETFETAAPGEDDDFQDDGAPLLDAKQETLRSSLHEILPSELLQARYAAVPFNDAARAKAQCLAWCQDAAQPAAGRLYHGPGGAGKTRLMIEVAAGLREAGWTAGFLNRDFGELEAQREEAWQALERRVLRGKDAGVLIVLDHAEARQAEAGKIARLLLRKRANASRPLRLVLLCRDASFWWERLREENDGIARLFAGAPDPLALNLMSSVGARQALFKESTVRFWPILQAQGYARPTAAPPRERLERITRGDGFERPLAIMMEALLYLCATPPAAGDGIGKQLSKVRDLELASWGKLLGPLTGGSLEDLEHATAQVTAVGGAPSESAAEALLLADEFHEERRTGDIDVEPALYNLACLYGRDDGSIVPIEPDLLGEHHLAATADAELIEGCFAWIGVRPEAEREARSRHLITMLQRAADTGHGVKAGKAAIVLDGLILYHLSELAADFAAVLISTPGPLKGRIEILLGALDFEALRALDLALPKSPPGLLEFAYKTASRHAAQATSALSKLRSEGADAGRLEFALKDIGDALSSVGRRLSALGKHDEALSASLEAARIYRHLAKSRFDSHAPDLAISLRGLGQTYLGKGQNKEAMAALEEALAAVAPFFEKTPEVFWRLVESLIGDYAVACSLADADGNTGLVERIEAVIERAKVSAIGNSAVPEEERERFASIQALFEKAQETGMLGEELLAKLPPDTAKQARSLWAALEGQKVGR